MPAEAGRREAATERPSDMNRSGPPDESGAAVKERVCGGAATERYD